VGDLGRFTDAEAILESLFNDHQDAEPKVRDEIRHTLSELLFWEGRRAPMKRLIEAGGGGPPTRSRNCAITGASTTRCCSSR